MDRCRRRPARLHRGGAHLGGVRVLPGLHRERVAPPSSRTSTGRLEGLHGLRGVAVLLVVLFHVVGAGRVSGGIDVFLAISGFLFTGLILRRLDAGSFDISAYLARLVRRLVPPVLPVLAFVLVGSLWWFPSSARLQTWRETAATLLYRENFELIDSQLAYEAAGVEASPLQHFWSLSVQGQFYLLWPLVLGLCWWLARLLRVRRVLVVAAGIAAVVALSLVYALQLRAHDQAIAYLHTGGRLWELALPGLLALALPSLQGHLPRDLRVALGWLGLALIISCGFVLDGAQLFPGLWALWPVGGLLLILVAGDTGVRGSADQLLSTPPARWLGDRSYALYLWHWPLLITALNLTHRPAGDLVLSAAVILASLLLADLTLRLVERPTAPPLRWPAPHITALAGVTALALLAGSLLGAARWVQAGQEREIAAAREAISASHPGALALEPGFGPVPEAPFLVPPELASGDKPQHDAQGCWQPATDSPDFAEAIVCPEPPGEEIPDPTRTIVITGGSHGAMWEPAWRVLAAEHRWRVLVMVKAGCQLTTNTGQFPRSTDWPTTASCQEWNRNAIETLRELDPDAVFTIATSTTGDGDPERASKGFIEAWEQLGEEGIPVVAVRDIFRMKERVPDCLEQHPNDPRRCDTPRQAAPTSPMTPAMVPDNVSLLDLTDAVCTAEVCPAVIGNIIVYFDHSHLSASYARTLAPALDAALRAEAPYLYAP
ncbi:acyltransferase family protein [Ornithinimicrobium sp. Y1847]|uniref:acyltransferase family protein n=1 Tax=Ornithinimicrobium sp. Y1847 TaxID=3405419 RepID=UPI003B66D66B